MTDLTWSPKAWDEYLDWQQGDKRTVKRINDLLKDVLRDPHDGTGIGKPERLRSTLAGCLSRRITDEHRLVYRVIENRVEIVQCRGHY